MDTTAFRPLRPLGFLPPLAARVAVGVVFIASGWGKLHDLGTVVDFFRKLGIPTPELQAPFVTTVELVGGGLVLVGFGARLASIFLMATMAVAIAAAIRPETNGIVDLLGRVEVLYLVLFGWIAVAGPGAISVETILARRRLGRSLTPAPAAAG
jgi:putative oxidoreductase